MSITGDPFISSLLEIFGNEVRFLCGVKREVEEMQIELRLMQCFLEDADRLGVSDISRVDRQMVSQIREESLDAEDVVESYLVELALRKKGGIFNCIKRFSCSVKEGRDMHKLGSDIEAIKSRLANLKTSLQTYGMSRDPRLGEASTSSGGQWLRQRQTFGHFIDPNIVGLDGKTEEVVGLLLREQKPYRVVSIYGMGGLGKTTLAKKVYHNDQIRSHFDQFVWVCVSQQFNPKDVLEIIYIDLTHPSNTQREEIKKFADHEIVRKLYQVQKDKKCFIVLDDIWSIEHWHLLSAAFAVTAEETAIGSKILLTTRKQDLAEYVDRSGSYAGLEPLSTDQSWELLQKIAFDGRDDITDKESMEKLGKEMSEHCGGLPLAIKVLAGTLATKESVRDWQIVHDNIKTYLRGKGGNDEECFGVDGVLSFSYYNLPHQLKSCFLYLSQFPEDHEIQTSRLLKMWVAEGFVSIQNDGVGEETVEDMAERYLNELVGRCMIQVGMKGSSGRIKTCRMHDLMRDMCLSKAKEENFIQRSILGVETKTVGKVRRLSLFREGDRRVFHYQSNYKLRSLILYCQIESLTSARMITNFKFLRMLVLEGIYIEGENSIKEIGNLIQLRYLSLRRSCIWCYPSIEKLRCLETLDLRTNGTPRNCVWLNATAVLNMKHLRHIYLPLDGMYPTRGEKVQIGMSNDNVQTLVNFPPPNCLLSDVVKFPKVRKLQIQRRDDMIEFGKIFRPDDNHKKVVFSHLSSLSVVHGDEFWEVDLQGILIGCPNLYKLSVEGCLVNFPLEFNQLARKLTKLILRRSQIEESNHIEEMIAKLPSLNIFCLEWDAFMGTELYFQHGSFPQLKSLILSGLDNLEEWRVDEGAMPILQSLEICMCYNLKMFPEGLRFIATLKKLHVKYMLLNDRVKEGGADRYKVQHVPTIIIEDGDI